MENLIYILLLIAWVAYSFYNAKQKKKQMEQQKKPSEYPEPVAKPMTEAKPQRSIFKDILNEAGMEDFEETKPAYEPEYSKPVRKTNIFSYEDPETWDESERQVLRTGIQAREEAIPKKVELVSSGQTGTPREPFDLRKAIIYAVILERPYH